MPISKIPKNLKGSDVTAIHQWCVFNPSISVAINVIGKIKKSSPFFGYQKIGKEKIYYCLLGLLNDDDIYKSK